MKIRVCNRPLIIFVKVLIPPFYQFFKVDLKQKTARQDKKNPAALQLREINLDIMLLYISNIQRRGTIPFR